MRANGTVEGDSGPWDAYVWVDDADELYSELRSKGVTIAREICERDYGCRDFDILDFNGYRLCFGQDVNG
jgi:predicted enzyme related to lactoylglutathione lyase